MGGTKNRLKDKLLEIKPLINYNINEYLPKDKLNNSRHSLNRSILSNSLLNVANGNLVSNSLGSMLNS